MHFSGTFFIVPQSICSFSNFPFSLSQSMTHLFSAKKYGKIGKNELLVKVVFNFPHIILIPWR